MLLYRIYLRLLRHESLQDALILLFNLFLHVFVDDLAMGSMPHQHFRGYCANLLWRRPLNCISASRWSQLILEWGFRRDQKGRELRLFIQVLRRVQFRSQAIVTEGTTRRRLEQLLFVLYRGCLEDPLCLAVDARRLIIVVNVVDTRCTFHDVAQAISYLLIVALPKFLDLLQSQAPFLRILLELSVAFGLVI